MIDSILYLQSFHVAEITGRMVLYYYTSLGGTPGLEIIASFATFHSFGTYLGLNETLIKSIIFLVSDNYFRNIQFHLRWFFSI